MTEMQVVILAGGEGLRMRPLTVDRQKCLLHVDGAPILEHVLNTLVAVFGSIDVTISVHYCGDQIEEFLRGYRRPNVRTHIVYDITGSRCPVYDALRSQVRGDFLMVDGDIIAPPSVYRSVWTTYLMGESELVESFSTRLELAPTHAVAKVKAGRVVEHHWPLPSVLHAQHVRGMDIFATNATIFDHARATDTPDIVGLCSAIARLLQQDIPIGAIITEYEWLHVAQPADLAWQWPADWDVS